MSNIPDGPLRRMWAKAGVVPAAPAETKPPKSSSGPSLLSGEIEALPVEIGEENVDPTHATETVNASDTSDTSDGSDAGAEYERERELRIARNKERMKHLGIDTLSKKVGSGDEKIKKSQYTRRCAAKHARTESEHPPIRRSTRSSARLNPVVDDVSEEALVALGETSAARRARQALSTSFASNEPEPISAEVFEESAVMRYACRVASHEGFVVGKQSPIKDARLFGWDQDTSIVFTDPACKKGFYSLDVFNDRKGSGSLMAAGGDGGRVAVFAMDQEDVDSVDKNLEESQVEVVPLASWVAHRGWCAHVEFFSCDLKNVHKNAPFVLTCGGMDGTVALWNLGLVGTQSGRPSELLRDSNIHSGGIFSAHVHKTSRDILTSSKDGSVCVSRVSDVNGSSQKTLTTTSRFDDKHAGVVKCCRWRLCSDGDGVFGTCGNDGTVRVFDQRASKATHCIDDAHGGYPVNFIEWACGASASSDDSRMTQGTNNTDTANNNTNTCTENAFITSASNDPRVLLWDLRRLQNPVASLEGHVPSNIQKPKQLYRPIFVEAGNSAVAVCVPGPKSNALSLYNVSQVFEQSTLSSIGSSDLSTDVKPVKSKTFPTINPITRGDVGFDASSVVGFSGAHGRGAGRGNWTLALANRGEVSVYRPKWRIAE